MIRHTGIEVYRGLFKLVKVLQFISYPDSGDSVISLSDVSGIYGSTGIPGTRGHALFRATGGGVHDKPFPVTVDHVTY